MRINSRRALITRLAMPAFVACFFLHFPVQVSQGRTNPRSDPQGPEYVELATSVLAGLGREQTMRITVHNPLSPRGPLRAQVRLFDSQSRLIAESAEAAIPPGDFRSFDFNRSDIPLAGERGNGRLQVRATITVFEERDINGLIRDQFPTAVELMDSRTGVGQAIVTAVGPYAPIIIATDSFHFRGRSPAPKENGDVQEFS